MKKVCTICGVEKDTSEFYARKASGDGLQSKCKICQKAQDAALYQKNKELIKERSSQWAEEHPEERKVIEAKYRKEHRPEQNIRTQNYRARKRSATVDDWHATKLWWNELLQAFENKCAYCRSERKLTLDHVIPLNRGGKHAPENIVPACESCNYTKRDQLLDELGWKCYVPNTFVRMRANDLMSSRPGLSYQRAIREIVAQDEGQLLNAPSTMAGAYVTAITHKQASDIILRYEWLGTMGRPQACYGLWFDINGVPTLAGAVCFGFATGRLSGAICGEEYVDKAIALERGACVYWAPKNAASWFVPKAVAMASREHGWTIFYAYSDPAANEVGTIYQACNWLYLGIGPGHGPTRERWIKPNGVVVSSRSLRYNQLKSSEAVALGWKREVVPARGKYIWFEGTPRYKKLMRKKLVHSLVPYVKRATLK